MALASLLGSMDAVTRATGVMATNTAMAASAWRMEKFVLQNGSMDLQPKLMASLDLELGQRASLPALIIWISPQLAPKGLTETQIKLLMPLDLNLGSLGVSS